MDRAKYLERIDYNGALAPTLEVLQELQQKHLFNIPFENLDIHFGDHIHLDVERIYEKIVIHNRGGFCYELNGLFFELLKSIGFEAQLISARVYEKGDEYSPEFDHMAIMVRIGDTNYLVDVGFGEFIFSPLKVETGIEQVDLRATYRIKGYDERYLQVTKKEDNEWVPEYIFDPRERALKEFEPRCEFHQTSSESHFQQKKVCSRPIENGRLTVSSDKVKIMKNGNVEVTELKSEAEFRDALRELFHITI